MVSRLIVYFFYLRCDPHFKSSRRRVNERKREKNRNVIDRNVHRHTNKNLLIKKKIYEGREHKLINQRRQKEK